MSLCDDCIKGVRHEGTPTGKMETWDGVSVYVALPEGDYSKEKAILYLPDAMGIQSDNAKLLMDDFALNGFAVYGIDYYNGEPIPMGAMVKHGQTVAGGFDIMAWVGRHGADVTNPPLYKVIDALKAKGITRFGATGYCFGGRYVFNLGFENIIHVAVCAHPSLLKCPEDLERYSKESKAPLLINACEVDQQFPLAAQAQADEILGGGKFAPGYVKTYAEGCVHGFAVRGDLKDPKVVAGKENAFKASVEYFKKYL